MNIFELSGLPLEPLDPANFTGGGTLVRIHGVSASPPIDAYRVTFDAGTRTAWHSHTGSQLLIVVEGRCRFQGAGGPVREIEAGGIVSIEPGETHWHGASPGASCTHLAVNVETETTWLGAVSDDEYTGS